MAVRHKKIAVVTGGSSGIGRCTAAALRDKGYLVYEFSRRHIPISGVNHLSVDVTDEEMVTSAIHHMSIRQFSLSCTSRAAAILSISAPWQPQPIFLFRPSTLQAKLPFHPILTHWPMKSDLMASMSQQ